MPVISADPPAPGWLGIYEPNTRSADGNGYPFDCLNHESYLNPPHDYTAEMKQVKVVKDACAALESVHKTWVAPTDFIVRQRKKGWSGDIFPVAGSHWAFNDRAKEVLEPIFGSHAEFLPLKPINAERLWVLHPLLLIKPSFDFMYFQMPTLERSPFDLDVVAKLPVFHFGPLGVTKIHCVSEDVKRACAEHGINGWLFKELRRFEAKKAKT